MKTLNFLSYTIFILFLTISITSCNGDDGEIGPAGPAGEDGNANVIMKVVEPDGGAFISWTAGQYLGRPANFHEIVDTDLTQAVVDNALIEVYYQLNSQDVWYPMNLHWTREGGTTEQVITYTYELNKITIYSFDDSGVLSASITKVKYFIIPAN